MEEQVAQSSCGERRECTEDEAGGRQSKSLGEYQPDHAAGADKPLTDARCVGDPASDPESPDAPFDTLLCGEGVGELNGQPGSIVKFVYIDNGESGNTDRAQIQDLVARRRSPLTCR